MFGFFAAWAGISSAQPSPPARNTNEIRVAEFHGTVEISLAGSTTWLAVSSNQVLRAFDRLRSGRDSRGALFWSDNSVVPFGALTEIEILPPAASSAQCGLYLIRGIVSFFHRDKPGSIRVITRGAVAGVEGTEFVVSVDDTGRTTLSVIDGKVQFGNEQGTLVLTNGQQAIADFDKTPAKTAGFIANNVLQWCFYYPAVLDPDELQLTSDEQSELAASLAAYRQGDLLAALASYPASNPNVSDNERVYEAALLLATGNVEQMESALAFVSTKSERLQRLTTALRILVAAVKRQPFPTPPNPRFTTELLALSYFEQSRAIPVASLENALHLVRQAATNSPDFGFAWERLAELEFSFGHTANALDDLGKSLVLAPRNAQAFALKGFLIAAQNQTREAIAWFDRAIALDSALGNAWLGRGLCRIRSGDTTGGREDLLLAAALEPQRAELRSYLGKAFANKGDYPRATHELLLAKKLDPNDPTAWLYSALIDQRENLINDAIRDLEKSEALNGNRSVYRSQLLLDQDQAVRAANLATVYRDAGMFDVSVREAARAVNYDYANYSAHLFLADSYNGLRDPNAINQRYETPAQGEYLVANLLAPVSAGPFSPTISQGEYSRLFAHDGFGVVSDTEYLSRGAWTQSGAQFGVFGDFSYDVEAYYHSDPGQRVNDDIEQRQLSITLKQQLTPKDSVYLNVVEYDANFGDVSQYYAPSMANPDARVQETQNPIVGLGYNHEWSPGVHTLMFLARLEDNVSLANPVAPTLVEFIPAFPPLFPTLTSVQRITMRENFANRLTIYSGELQQILEQPAHTTIIGTRIQYGHFDASNLQDSPSTLNFIFPDPPEPDADQNLNSLFRRVSFYGYHQWQIFEPLQLIGGVAYDHITFPENFRTAPISGNEQTEDQVSPKAGIIWTPLDNTVVRFAYTRSLSGASLDQSYQIEPSQVAGFIQNYRSVIPESIAGGNAGANIETYDLSLEQKFRTGTYLAISGEILNSTVNRIDGAFDYNPFSFTQPYPVPSGMHENLDYQENTLQVTANQLLGRDWALGAVYRVSEATLNDNFGNVPDGLFYYNFQPRSQTRATLQQLDLTVFYNNPSGFFAEGEALWFGQSNVGYPNATTPAEPGDDFWQFNLFAGWRFAHRKVEASVGLLNLTGQDYRLNPLNVYNELPRSRTLAMRLQINF
jgi:tetratricopeptide (TPR) repeat protein/outer membrane receptor protein involved in Fe transport